MSQVRKVSYRTGLFDPSNLTTTEHIENVLLEFSCVLTQANHEQVLEDLFDQNHIIELILSGSGDNVPLNEWILAQFPTSAKLYESSFAAKLLKKLSHFFLFNLSPSEELPETVRNHHQTASLAPEILEALFSGNFLDDTTIQADSQDRSASSKKLKGKSTQREAKLAKKAAARQNALDEQPFISLGLSVPRTSSDAEATGLTLLNRLRAILELYLTIIRTAQICNLIRENFLPQDRPSLRVTTEMLPDTDEDLPSAPATTSEVHSVYPLVQPMKSALYFDSPEGFGKWTILVSQAADKNLREYHKRSKKSFNIIVKKIKQLSQGHFSRDNQKRLNGPTTEIPIFEAKMTRDLRLVYQVDCVTGYDNKSTVQVLRLFGIYTHAQMDNRMWEHVGSYLSKRGKQYRDRCLERVSVPGPRSDMYNPAGYSSDMEVDVEDVSSVPDLPMDNDNQLHRILTLEKYVTLSKELLESIEEDREAAFPFETSKQEKAIIQHPYSCYVLGRSGTGKTTTMLFKMLWIERAYQMEGQRKTRPRQVFVTKSGVLVGKVQDHFRKYLSSLASASHVGRDDRSMQATAPTDDDQDLYIDDSATKWRNDLPRRVSQLEDHHFPLFVTFDQLCAMVELDIEEARKSGNVENRLSRQEPQAALAMEKKGRLVTFDRFMGEYWPHFKESVTKKFHPSLVFNEIMGVILGSEGTIVSEQGYLDRETYEKLSCRTQPMFAGHRPILYDVFLSYLAAKQELGDFDASERTQSLIRGLFEKNINGQKFEYLYVDETQDNLLIDALLLRMLCNNPNGLFWAGDTAQTISAGSSFRFNDLKAFLYRIDKQNRIPVPESSTLVKPRRPQTFHLAVNYRSHAGIVNCAHSVVELISQYFPYTIDALSPERGTANGAKPVFYTAVYPGFIREGHFLARNDKSDDKIELGANQCILVRDETAKQQLAKEIGKVGLIMTLYDSKGLEFNDVLLYNFFHDSPINASQWRVVLKGIPSSQATPDFDELRHAALCSELKCLYVAITRARNNLRIVDESLKGESMRALWESCNQIRSCSPGDDLADFAVPSSKEEWAQRGKEFMDNQQYALARDSYEKAQKPRSVAIAQAYHLREVAMRTPAQPAKNKDSRAAAFRLASKAFCSCASTTDDIKYQKGYHGISADCLEQAGDILAAAQTYRLAENFTKAALLFRKIGKFDDVNDIIVEFADMIDSDVLESVQDVVRLYYFSQKEFGKAHRLFGTLDEEIEYLEDRNLDMAQLDLLLLHGRQIEAAELHLAEGRLLQAVDLFLDISEEKEYCTKKAKDCIFEGLWKLMSFGALHPCSKADEVNELLVRFHMLDHGALDQNDWNEIEMFTKIVSGESDELSRLTEPFLEFGNTDAALLCFDHEFTRTPSFSDLDIFQMAQILNKFFNYIRILHDLAFVVDPSSEPRIWKLFGIQANQQDGTFGIPSGTFIHRQRGRAFIGNAITDGNSDSDVILPREKLVEIFRSSLQERLLDCVTRENDSCRKAPALILCLRHIAFGDCPTPCSRSHISPDPTWYQCWIKVHLLQILIYHSISPVQFSSELRSQQRFWVRKLHEVLHPPHYALGSICNLDHETGRAFTVVIDWIRSLSYSLEFRPPYRFLTIAIQTADFAFMFDRKDALTYMRRSNFATAECPPEYLRGDNRQNALQEMLISFSDNDPSSVLMGILFIRHVMELSIAVDLDVFCCFIERICGLLILSNLYSRYQDLHNVTLPYSWLRTILTYFDLSVASKWNHSYFWLLLEPLERLLNTLYFPQYPESSHIMYGEDFRSITFQGKTIRSLYIARICRVLGLLGSNIRVQRFQEQIWNLITSLRRGAHHGFNPNYSRYVYAESWAGIFSATRGSMQRSHLDGIVQLLNSRRIELPIRFIPGIRSIVYTAHAEILSLLGGSFSSWSSFSSDDHISRPFSTHEAEHTTLEDEQVDETDELELVPEDVFQDTGEEDPDFIPITKIPEDMYIGHSEKESGAASLIQKVYRKFQERKRALERSGLAAAVYRWSALYKKNGRLVQGHTWPTYSLRYLGCVPLLLACLEAVESLVFAKKTESKGRLLREDSNHEDLDEVSRALTRSSTILKGIKQHRLALEPEADVHHRRDLEELERRVRAALDLLIDLQLPIEVPDFVTEALALVFRGILQKKQARKTPKNRRRPALGYEEDDAYLDYEGDWEEELTE